MRLTNVLKRLVKTIHDPVDYRKEAKRLVDAGLPIGPGGRPVGPRARRENARVEGATMGRQ